MLNFLVTGAKGQLGQCFKSIKNDFSNYNLIFTDKEDLDITNKKLIQDFYDKNPFDGIINCAAYTKVDRAELRKQKAFSVNVNGVENLISIAEKNKLSIINFSTDYIFDGKDGSFYDEFDKANPINTYGISKQKGEELLKGELLQYYIEDFLAV